MKKWIKYPNGKVWRADPSNMITGTVTIDNSSCIDLETLMDAIAVAATGSSIGLQDIAYQVLGGDMVSFTALSTHLLDDEEDRDVIALADDSAELRQLLQEQYGVDEAGAEHMLDNVTTKYGEECVIQLTGSARELRCPAHPEDCGYVRVVADGLEIAYWIADEWQQAPAAVMGALIGALAARR